jgi:hypothetical protein
VIWELPEAQEPTTMEELPDQQAAPGQLTIQEQQVQPAAQLMIREQLVQPAAPDQPITLRMIRGQQVLQAAPVQHIIQEQPAVQQDQQVLPAALVQLITLVQPAEQAQQALLTALCQLPAQVLQEQPTQQEQQVRLENNFGIVYKKDTRPKIDRVFYLNRKCFEIFIEKPVLRLNLIYV